MDKIKLIHDQVGESLILWLGNPEDEVICEETGDGIILMKDKLGKVIGIEVLYFKNKSLANIDLQTYFNPTV
jgi:uncharacterized protein YuzE